MKTITRRYVNKARLERLIKGKYGTYRAFYESIGMSRQRLWVIMTKPHRSADEQCIRNLASILGVEAESILEKE